MLLNLTFFVCLLGICLFVFTLFFIYFSIAHVLKQSGCDVPDYMLAMKKRSKTAKKKLETSAPKRDDISVKPNKRFVMFK